MLSTYWKFGVLVSGCSSLFAKVSLGEILNGNASRYSLRHSSENWMNEACRALRVLCYIKLHKN